MGYNWEEHLLGIVSAVAVVQIVTVLAMRCKAFVAPFQDIPQYDLMVLATVSELGT